MYGLSTVLYVNRQKGLIEVKCTDFIIDNYDRRDVYLRGGGVRRGNGSLITVVGFVYSRNSEEDRRTVCGLSIRSDIDSLEFDLIK